MSRSLGTGIRNTAIEMKRRIKPGRTTTMMLSDAFSRIRWPKKYYSSIFYIVDIVGCQFCENNDDALLDIEDKLSLSSVGGMPCSKTMYKGCDLFPISFFGAWDYEEDDDEEPQSEQHQDHTTIAITLTGLSGADDTEACNNFNSSCPMHSPSRTSNQCSMVLAPDCPVDYKGNHNSMHW